MRSVPNPDNESLRETDAVDRLVAHDQIRLLTARYALAVDSRDIGALVHLFVPDVRVGRKIGRDALREEFETSLAAVGVTILNVGTQVIELVDASHATGEVYCTGEVQVGDEWVRQAIRYLDSYECCDGQWLFVRRVHELWYGVAIEPNPLQQSDANWPASAVGRGTLPASWPSWAVFWHPEEAALDTPPNG